MYKWRYKKHQVCQQSKHGNCFTLLYNMLYCKSVHLGPQPFTASSHQISSVFFPIQLSHPSSSTCIWPNRLLFSSFPGQQLALSRNPLTTPFPDPPIIFFMLCGGLVLTSQKDLGSLYSAVTASRHPVYDAVDRHSHVSLEVADLN